MAIRSNNRIIGILANVDSGKTTLAETLLYHGGVLRSMGRVDHGDAFLDTGEMERQRGITIFSKIARLSLPGSKPAEPDLAPRLAAWQHNLNRLAS